MSSQPLDLWLAAIPPEKLGNLLDALGEGIVALDTEGRVVGMNRAACRLLESDISVARPKLSRSVFGTALAGRLERLCQALHQALPAEEVRGEWISPSGVRRLFRFLGAASFEVPRRGRCALLVCQDETHAAGLVPGRPQAPDTPASPAQQPESGFPSHLAYPGSIPEDDPRELLRRTLEATGWNVAKASRRLKISRTTIYERIRRFGLVRPPD